MINTILFDWDGTLINSLNEWMGTFRKVFSKAKLTVSDDDFKRMIYGNSSDLRYFAQNKFEEILRGINEDLENWMFEPRFYGEVKEVLEGLRKKEEKMAIVTTSPRVIVSESIKKTNLDRYFDVVLGFEDVNKHKPNPEIVVKAIDLLSGKLEETLIVGDSANDIRAGRAARIKTCFYYPKENQEFYNLTKKDIGKPDFIIEDLREVLEIVKS